MDVGLAGLIASRLAPTGETRSHPEPGRLPGRLVVDVDLGTPSLGEVPSGGAEVFWLLLTGPASGLFESDPPSGRNPKQPLPQKRIYTPSKSNVLGDFLRVVANLVNLSGVCLVASLGLSLKKR